MRPITPLALLLAVAPALGGAQAPGPTPPPQDSAPSETPPPPGPPPSEVPPPPSEATPPQYQPTPAPSETTPPPYQGGPPPYQATPAPPAPQPAAAPAGEWVYTSEYGWLYMPFARRFVYVPPDPQVFPEEYVYYPAYGWRWVVAPWVYGYGPQPRWGPGGPTVFVWYARPWFRVGGYWGWGAYRGWGGYRGWIGPRVWGPRGWVGAPPYYRTGVGHARPAPVFRPGPVRRTEHGRERGERRERER